MKYWLDFITKVEPMGWSEINGINCQTYYHVGENFLIEVNITAHDKTRKTDIANLWKKYGMIDRFLPTHIGIKTYYTDKDGNCSGRYNIQHTRDGKIDFNYMLEATPENVNKLLAECIRMYEMNIA